MSDSRVIWYAHRKLTDPIAIVGFPSVGLVSSIVTSFIARDLKMPVVAGITAPELPPYALIQGGVPYPQIRVYAVKAAKKKAAPIAGKTAATEEPAAKDAPAKSKKSAKKSPSALGRDLVVVTSEIAPRPEQTYNLMIMLMDTLKQLGVSQCVCLEGIPRFENGSNATMLAVGSNPNMRKLAKQLGINYMDEGLVRGTTGVLLYASTADKTNLLTLLCPANPQLPDPRAAVTLLDPLSKLVPGLNLDTTPLFKEAEEIEQRMKMEQKQANTNTQQIYG